MVVPPSTVNTVTVSMPDEVSEGAFPPAQSISVSQVSVFDHPFVIRKVMLPQVPDTGGLVSVRVNDPVRVKVCTFPSSKLALVALLREP